LFFKRKEERQRNLNGCDLILGERVSVDYDKINARPGTRIAVGEDSILRGEIIMERVGANLEIGSRVYFGGFISCAERVLIGDDVLISGQGGIFDHASHSLLFSERATDVLDWKRDAKNWDKVPIAATVIESKAWIGFRAIILKGVTIGEGAVVGAGTVVTKSVPPWCVFAGSPGRVLRELGENER
jgi:galactoside O-acetyltransferase